jgi:hypothetical protein
MWEEWWVEDEQMDGRKKWLEREMEGGRRWDRKEGKNCRRKKEDGEMEGDQKGDRKEGKWQMEGSKTREWGIKCRQKRQIDECGRKVRRRIERKAKMQLDDRRRGLEGRAEGG